MAAHPVTERDAPVDPTEWVDQYGNMLMGYAPSRLPGPEIAEDLVQETFLAAWKRHSEFDSRSRFSTWLISILRRKIADHYRTAGRKLPQPESLTEGPSAAEPFTRWGKWAAPLKKFQAAPDELAQDREFWRVFARCLAEMPAHLSYVFRLRELKSATTAEIGDLMEISSTNVSVRLHRALAVAPVLAAEMV